ncbi:MAG: PilZ domain-containing protein [Spirochaetes bacterium]|nr:PilZ domain-containing protein [Spirochaetota bacterium]MBN2769780.1 PilZ domain-containing protein [Spirochaetota bacterium]
MNNMICFNKLSNIIQNEIIEYHEKKVRSGNTKDINDSVKQWFDNCFEQWLRNKGYVGDKENKRMFTRIEIEIPLKVSQTLIDDDETDSPEILTRILNISRGGMFFRSPVPFKISSIIKVEICLSDVEEIWYDIEALAMITRCVKISDNVFGVGVTFSSIYNESMDSLSLFIFKHLVYYIQLEE